jgi:hypothetical protein
MLQLTAAIKDQFDRVPNISGVWKGLLCHLPTNYNPVTRTYSEGTPWAGTFKTTPEWTDNPFWIAYELIVNPRIGMVRANPRVSVNRYKFYELAKHADELLSDGKGGQKPRYTFNALITDPMDGIELINHIVGTAHAYAYEDGLGNIVLAADRNTPAVATVTREMCVESMPGVCFEYTFTDLTERPNEFVTSYVDPDMGWEIQFLGPLVDSESVERNGYNRYEYQSVGCIYPQEAWRKLYFQAITATTEVTTVSFEVSVYGILFELFDIINVCDPDMDWGMSGRARSITGTTVMLRDAIYFESAGSYDFSLVTNEGVVTRSISVVTPGLKSQLTLNSPITEAFGSHPSFTIGKAGDPIGMPKPFRIVQIGEVAGDPSRRQIVAVEVNRLKYESADKLNLTDIPGYSWAKKPTSQAPTNLRVVKENRWATANGGYRTDLLLAWDYEAERTIGVRFEVYKSINGGGYELVASTPQKGVELTGLPFGSYEFKVVAVYQEQRQATTLYWNIAQINCQRLREAGSNTTFTVGGGWLGEDLQLEPTLRLRYEPSGANANYQVLNLLTSGDVAGVEYKVLRPWVDAEGDTHYDLLYTELSRELRWVYPAALNRLHNNSTLRGDLVIQCLVKDHAGDVYPKAYDSSNNLVPAPVTVAFTPDGVPEVTDFELAVTSPWTIRVAAQFDEPPGNATVAWYLGSAANGSDREFVGRGQPFSLNGLKPETSYYLWAQPVGSFGTGSFYPAGNGYLFETPKTTDGDLGVDLEKTVYVYKRALVGPTAPASNQGTFESPVPAGWTQAIPEGSDPVWVTSRVYRMSGAHGSWQEPYPLGGETMQVQYSEDSETWVDTFSTGMVYMRVRIGAGNWSSAIRIVGEDGVAGADGTYVDYIFIRAESQPALPIGVSPVGWSGQPPEGSFPLWFSTVRKRSDGTLVTSWSTPTRLTGDKGPAGLDGGSAQVEYSVDGVNSWHATFAPATDKYMRVRVGAGAWSSAAKIVGEDGTPGTDGTYVDYRFQRAATQPATPTGNTPAGWTDTPPAGTAILWMVRATKTSAGNIIGSWSTPTRLTGDQGPGGNDAPPKYTWVVFADTNDGNSTLYNTNAGNHLWQGVAHNQTSVQPASLVNSEYSRFTWYRIKANINDVFTAAQQADFNALAQGIHPDTGLPLLDKRVAAFEGLFNELSALSANLGVVTSGTFQTSAAGSGKVRAVMSSSDIPLQVFDRSGVPLFQVSDNDFGGELYIRGRLAPNMVTNSAFMSVDAVSDLRERMGFMSSAGASGGSLSIGAARYKRFMLNDTDTLVGSIFSNSANFTMYLGLGIRVSPVGGATHSLTIIGEYRVSADNASWGSWLSAGNVVISVPPAYPGSEIAQWVGDRTWTIPGQANKYFQFRYRVTASTLAYSYATDNRSLEAFTVEQAESDGIIPLHQHTFAHVDGLAAALADKASLAHTHDWSQVQNKPTTALRWPTWAEVSGKPSVMLSEAGTVSSDAVPWNAQSGVYISNQSGWSAMIAHFYSAGGSTPSMQLKSTYRNGGLWYRSARDGFGFEDDWAQVATGNLPFQFRGNNYLDFGPNANWGGVLRIGGNGRTDATKASVVATNGNLHIDPKDGNHLYLNFFAAAGTRTFFQRGAEPFYLDSNGDINGKTISARRFATGADQGIDYSVMCTNWFRSVGATGWYSQTYGGGIYMEDTTWVRTYGTKKFHVNNTDRNAIDTAGGFNAWGGQAFNYAGKCAIGGVNDTWLRLNPYGEFTSGIYCGNSILQTDAELHVGSGGAHFRATAAGAQARSHITGSLSNVMTWADFRPNMGPPPGLENTITTNWLSAGAVTANILAAYSINASHLTISDFTNIITNGLGQSLAGWHDGGGAAPQMSIEPSNLFGTGHIFNVWGRDHVFGHPFPVTAGDQFFCSFSSVPYGGGPGNFAIQLGLQVFDGSGATIAWIGGAVRAAGIGGTYQATGVVTIPGGAASARVWFQIDTLGSSQAAGDGYHTSRLEMYRRNNGNLIVDGAITANKIAAGTITGDKIQAGTSITAPILRGGRAEMVGANAMRVTSALAFGPDSLITWFGPKAGLVDGSGNPNLALLTKANATTWEDGNGNAYFGGQLSAGTLSSAGTFNLSPSNWNATDWISVLHANSNGRSKTVIVNADVYHGVTQIETGTGSEYPGNVTDSYPARTATFRFRLYRGTTVIATWTKTATSTARFFPYVSGDPWPPAFPGSTVVTHRFSLGSQTITDTSTLTGDVEYRLVIDVTSGTYYDIGSGTASIRITEV